MNRYFEESILTATPLELVRMLYSRSVTLLGEAKDSLEAGRIAESTRATGQAYAIVSELMVALRPEAAPEIGPRLLKLYAYVQSRILEGQTKRSAEALGEAESIMRTLAEGWAEVKGAPVAGVECEETSLHSSVVFA